MVVFILSAQKIQKKELYNRVLKRLRDGELNPDLARDKREF